MFDVADAKTARFLTAAAERDDVIFGKSNRADDSQRALAGFVAIDNVAGPVVCVATSTQNASNFGAGLFGWPKCHGVHFMNVATSCRKRW